MSAITIIDLNEDETLDKARMEALRGGAANYFLKFTPPIAGEREEWSWDLSSVESTRIGDVSFR